MPTLTRAQCEIYYEVHGDGPSLVFAHGAGGNTLVWFQQVAHFAPRFRVVTFDHRGFGRSRCAPGYEGASHFADDLLAILDAAGVGDAALICQSMGGWTGLHFTLEHPERVRALVLSGTPAGLLTPKVAQALAALQQTLVAAGLRTPRWDEPHPALAADAFARDPRRAFLYAQIAALNPVDAVLRARLQEIPVDAERLATYATPTLVVAGENDRLFPPDALREVAALIPAARFAEIAVAGHSPYFEAPDEFNGLVEEFLGR